ncbi:MAG: type III-B CRISPR module RAMP protein Cmr4 [Chthoniobacterales bacterium]
MPTKLLYLFTRTPLHVGVGSSVGAVDLPVRCERHTNHPIIPGSSIKGVFRDCARNCPDTLNILDLFGPETDDIDEETKAKSGDLAFGEARPLAFPVRAAKGVFAYITCPFILQRFAREAGLGDLPDLPQPEDQSCHAGTAVTLTNPSARVVLEEYAFSHLGNFPEEWEQALLSLNDDPVWQEAKNRLVLLSDGDFSHFVTTTTEISTQTKIDAETGAVAKGALFNMECVPAETLFAAPIQIIGRYKDTDSTAQLDAIVKANPIMQFGGNSTTGRGFCSVTLK